MAKPPKQDDLWLPNDPNKGIPISELIKRGEFKTVVENTQWFDEHAKPRKKEDPEQVNFEPERDKDADV